MNAQEIVDNLISQGAILIGSGALGINSRDVDLAITMDMLTEVYPYLIGSIHDIAQYFQADSAMPADGSEVKLIRNLYRNSADTDIDLLIYQSKDHLSTIRTAMVDLQALPYYMVVSKGIRIDLYNEALVFYGFTRLHQLSPTLSSTTDFDTGVASRMTVTGTTNGFD